MNQKLTRNLISFMFGLSLLSPFSPPKLLRLNDWKLNELRNSSGNGFSWPPGCKLFCAKDYYAKTILLLFSFFPSVLFSLLGGQSEMGTTYYVLRIVPCSKRQKCSYILWFFEKSYKLILNSYFLFLFILHLEMKKLWTGLMFLESFFKSVNGIFL